MRGFSAALLVTLLGAMSEPSSGDQVVNDAKWATVAPMSEARLGHAMVELPTGANALGLSTGRGKVMVIGGFDSSPNAFPFVPATPLASCEIYDPTKNTWTPAAPHPVPGGWRWTTVLKNGMVLVAGGSQSLEVNLADSRLYDPRTNRWIATKPLPIGTNNPHAFMHPVLLPNGQILIAGGEDDSSIVGGELTHSHSSYLFTLNERQPALSFWDYTRNKSNRRISEMPDGRTTSGLLLMKNGRVLNVGGLGPSFEGTLAATRTVRIFDPETGLWTRAAPMPAIEGGGEDEFVSDYPNARGSRWAPLSVNLDDGRVLVAGGFGGTFFQVYRKSAVIYDPRRDVWQVTTPMHFRRYVGSWTGKLPSGDILFAGVGFSDDLEPHDATGEIFDQATRSWRLAPTRGGPPIDGTIDSFESQLVRLSSGRMQTTGGADLETESLGTTDSWMFAEGR